MEYRLLGLSGCAVSALALGTLTFGNEASEADSFAQLDRFVSAGGTLIDTADVYADGRSEQIIGRWLASRAEARERVVIATKGRFPTSEDPNGHGLSRRHLAAALDASLRRLGVEVIDLYQLHGWDPLTPVEETLRFLDDAAQAGKIGYTGLSNFLGYQIQKYVDLADAHELIRPVTVQPQYNLLARAIEWEGRAGLPGRRAGPAGLVPAGQRLADRQVPAGRAAPRGHQAVRPDGPGHADLERARAPGAQLAGHRRGPQGRRGPRCLDVTGGDRLGAGPPGGSFGDPRRSHPGPAR